MARRIQQEKKGNVILGTAEDRAMECPQRIIYSKKYFEILGFFYQERGRVGFESGSWLSPWSSPQDDNG